MANTIVTTKSSIATAFPPSSSLLRGEQAYSYVSDRLFIGDSDNTGVIEIGGKYYIGRTNAAFDRANAAYALAESGGGDAGAAIAAAYAHANAAYAFANTANIHANSAFTHSNSAFIHANSSYSFANTVNTFAYAARANANAAAIHANSAFIHANSSFIHANAAFLKANSANVHANAAYNFANTSNIRLYAAYAHANAAYENSNTKFDTAGGTITGDVAITGNLSVVGTLVSFDTINYTIQDPLLLLANNNVSDVIDIGIAGRYQNGTSANVYTGVYRDAGTKEWYVFEEYNGNLSSGINSIVPGANNFTIATINANVKSQNIFLRGTNVYAWIAAAYEQANVSNTATISSGRISGSYTGITGVGTLTAGTWEAGTIQVPFGGTGRTSHTLNGILYGNTSGPLNITAAGTEGQVLQANGSGVPVFGMIDGGTF